MNSPPIPAQAHHRWPRPSELAAAVPGALVAGLYVLIAAESGSLVDWLLAATACCFVPALAYWRRALLPAGIAIGVLLAIWAVAFWTALPYNTGITPFLLTAPLVVFAWTRWAPAPAAGWVALAIACAGAFASPAMYMPLPDTGFDYYLWRVITHWAVLAAVFLAARSMRTAALAAEQRTRDAEQAAAAAERERIARELHDVLAHGLTLIRAQAHAGQVTARTDPEAAVASLTQIASAAGQSLSDVRAFVTLLRETDGAPEPAPAGSAAALPSADLTALPQVVTAFTATGMHVGAALPPAEELAAAQATLPLAVRLAVRRIIQEALTNARRHAPEEALTELQLDIGEHEIRITADTTPVATTPPRSSGSTAARRAEHGWGLTGLAERTALLGGTLTAGPTPAPGFHLGARIPTRQVST